MERLNSHFNISKLGLSSSYNRLRMSNQENDDEKRILHFSYNLVMDVEQDGYPRLGEEDGYSELWKRHNSTVRSRGVTHALNQEEEEAAEEKTQRKSSLRCLFNNEDENRLECPKAEKKFILYGSAIQGYLQEKSTEVSKSVVSAENVPKKTSRSGIQRRKCGLSEATNISLMGHRLRKKAVCDYTDNSHYQRQFLRVLKKRF